MNFVDSLTSASMQITRREPDAALVFSGSLTIEEAESLRDALSEYVQREDAPILDLSAVERCDTAALQLLWAAQKSAVQSGKPLQILSPSNAVAETFTALGLDLDAFARTGSGAGSAEPPLK